MNAIKRGTKRKRLAEPEQDLVGKIVQRLHHDLNSVRRVAKKAKTYETQRLVKRLKGMKKQGKSSSELADLETQLSIIKHLDLEPIARTALKNKLYKDHTLSADERVRSAIEDALSSNLIVPQPVGTPAAKVQSRLLSSKLLATKIGGVIRGLRSIVQPEEDPEAEPSPVDLPRRGDRVGRGIPEYEGVRDQSMSEDGDEGEEFSGRRDPALKKRGEAGADDGWESGSLASHAEEAVESGSSSSSDDERAQNNAEEHAPGHSSVDPRHSLRLSKNPQAAVSQSIFFPSLAVGYTRGESDGSDWSDADANIADPAAHKNRRGQRARRAIWEKKYGKNANHKKKEQDAHNTPDSKAPRNYRRNSSSAPRSNRPEASSFHPGNPHGSTYRAGATVEGQPYRLPKNSTDRSVASQNEERPLHPSWEAKKKLKEKQSVGILPAQGKRIKFS